MKTKPQEQHTPGPWYFDENTCYVRTDDILIAGAYNPGDNRNVKDAERTANGRLIAAAPQLLAALKACQLQMLQSNNDSEYAQEANRMANEAIAKAVQS